MPQPFTQTQPTMSEWSGRTSAPEPPIILHHNLHRIQSRQGATYATWLTIPRLSLWFVWRSAQEIGDQRDGPQPTQARLTIWTPLPTWSYHSCSSLNHQSYIVAQILFIFH